MKRLRKLASILLVAVIILTPLLGDLYIPVYGAESKESESDDLTVGIKDRGEDTKQQEIPAGQEEDPVKLEIPAEVEAEEQEATEGSIDLPVSRGAARDGGNAIGEAKIAWSSSMGDDSYYGYTLSGDTQDILTVDPLQNTEQTVKLQITFALTNGNTAEAGEVEIRIPQSIFYDRDGNPLVNCYIPLSTEDEGDTSFKYYIDDAAGEIVITNYKTFYSGSTFTCEVEYTVLPSDVEDGYTKDNIAASFEFSDSDTAKADSATSDSLTVVVNTDADLKRLNKSFHYKYETWQQSWGDKPANSEDYFYIAWCIQCDTKNTCTEPFTITFEDLAGQYGTVVGYCGPSALRPLTVEDETSIVMKVPGTTQNDNSWTSYVIVQYERSMLDADPEPEITNNITATLTEADGEKHTKDAEAKYTYQAVDLTYGGDKYTGSKASSGNGTGMINMLENDISGKAGVGSSSYSLTSTIQGWGLTQDDQGNYGAKKYTAEVIDGYRTDGTTGSLAIDDEILNPDDYEITSFYISYNEYDGEIDPNTGYKASEVTDFSTYKPVEVYVQTVGGSGDWVLVGSILRTSNNDYTYTDVDGVETKSVDSSKQIQLPEGTYAVKFSHTSSKYQVKIEPELTIKLNPTEHIKEILADRDIVYLQNSATLNVKNADDSIVKSISLNANMQMTRLNSTSKIEKNYLGKNSSANGYEILDYEIIMNEYAAYMPANIASDADTALEAVKAMGIVGDQTEGVFYDLLPTGTTVDPSTISVVTYGNKEVCTYAIDTIENWQGSGQTMLIIKVTAPGETNYYSQRISDLDRAAFLQSGFILKYSLIYTWQDYHDYGSTMLNSAAYRSGTGKLGDGGTAGSSTLTKKEYFADLDDDGQFDDQNEDTVYAQISSQISAASAAENGFSKAVKAADGLVYGESAVASAAGTYTYRLRYGLDENSGSVSGLVLYDVLEVYDSGDAEQWKGTFAGIDTSYAKNKGIDAVVYYSTKSGLDPEGNPGDADITDGTIWSAMPPDSDNLSTVTAVAVDLSKNLDGTDKVFQANETVACYITLQAPADYERWEGIYAYNSAHCKLTITPQTGDSETTLTECYPVKVELEGTDVEISKSSDPASGTQDAPTVVETGDTINYTVSVKNTNTAAAIENVEITDIIPAGLTVDINKVKYYMSDAEDAKLISETDRISVESTGQKLVFTIARLMAGETVSFIIPTTVTSPTVYENTAVITKINGSDFEINSETTYHKTEDSETVDVAGTKTWDDADDQAGKRPAEIKVNLLADNVLVESKTVTADADNNWAYQWTGLPKYADGEEIEYTLTEDPVSGYHTEVSGYNITNRYTPGETSRTVVKSWNDANDQDGKRPVSIDVQLKANGVDSGPSVTLSEAGGWTHTWNNLPEKKDGQDIVYTVEEITAVDGYITTYSTDGFIITNTYRPQILISKVNSAGSELAGATLTIYEADAAGKATDTIAIGKDGEELTWETTGEPQDITGISAGTYILHEEAAPRGYYIAYDILFTVNADGTVTKDSAMGDIDGNTIIMTDLKYGEVMPEWVALTIGKTVTGTAGDKEQEFTFTLELTYEDGEEVTEEFAYDGSKTGTIKSGESVKLKHGELIKIYGIPLDVHYTVTESDNEGYKVDPGKNAKGTIDELGRNVQFTNHKDKPSSVDNTNNGGTNQAKSPKTYTWGSTTTGRGAKTGDAAPLMLYGILLIAGVGIVGFLLYRKKRKA